MDGSLPYLLRTRNTRRAANALDAIDERQRRNALETSRADADLSALELASGAIRSAQERGRQAKRIVRAALRRDKLVERGSVLARERERLSTSIEKRRSAGEAQTSRRVKRVLGAPAPAPARLAESADRSFASSGDLPFDGRLGLWGLPRVASGDAVAPPDFGDAALDRLAAIWRVPGLSHLMMIQIERQMVFADFDAFVARHREFDALAFSPQLGDCEIDADIALALHEDDSEPVERLVAAVARLRRTGM